MKNLVIGVLLLFSFGLISPASAGMASELKRMNGFTILYAGHITDTVEKDYDEKMLQLDNGWVFKLDCLMLMPMDYTDVIVFGKRYPESLTKQYPNIPKHLLYQFKLLIDREVCDASLVQ